MSTPEAPCIIVFDAVCLLCNRWVAFVIRHDRHARIRFAAMQSASGQALLQRHGLDPQDPASLLLLADGVAYTDSEAIVRVLQGFGGAWRLAGLCRLIPGVCRDALYRLIARNRYRWFGRRDSCALPTAQTAARFLP